MVMAGASSASPSARWGSAPSPSRRSRTSSSRVFHDLGVPDDLLHPISFVLALAVAVYLHVVLGEMVPKNIALAGPGRAALLLGPPMVAVVVVFKLVVVTLNALANGCSACCGSPRGTRSRRRSRMTRSLRSSTSRVTRACSAGRVRPAGRRARLHGEDRGPVLLPRDSLATVRRGRDRARGRGAVRGHGLTRFPASTTEGDDELVGYVHIKDVVEVEPATTSRSRTSCWAPSRPCGRTTGCTRR